MADIGFLRLPLHALFQAMVEPVISNKYPEFIVSL
jgi:hypothetical protein